MGVTVNEYGVSFWGQTLSVQLRCSDKEPLRGKINFQIEKPKHHGILPFRRRKRTKARIRDVFRYVINMRGVM